MGCSEYPFKRQQEIEVGLQTERWAAYPWCFCGAEYLPTTNSWLSICYIVSPRVHCSFFYETGGISPYWEILL